MEMIFFVVLMVAINIWFCLYSIKEKANETKVHIKEIFVKVQGMGREKIILIAIMDVLGLITFLTGKYWYEKSIFMALRWQAIIMFSVPIACSDFKKMIIPNKMLFATLFFSMALIVFQMIFGAESYREVLFSTLSGAILAMIIFLIPYFIVKDGLGAGDVKMFFTFGVSVGFTGIFNIIMYTMVISALTGIFMMIFKKKKSKDLLPMAPFALIGIIIAVALGV